MMRPKQILLDLFQPHITPRLEARGFRFAASQFTYRKPSGDFTQKITVFLSHQNSSEGMSFHSSFSVWSTTYNRWLLTQGRPPIEGSIGGCADWNIPNWRKPGDFRSSEDFTDRAARETVVREWLERCEAAGLPYLERLSSWTGAAEEQLRRRDHFDQASDFFLINGDIDRSIAALEEGIRSLQARDFAYSENAHWILVEKKKKQAAERDAEVAAFRARIDQLRK